MARNLLQQWEADQDVLLVGNAVLFLLTLVSFLLVRRSIDHLNPNVFVRSVFGSFMIKLFVCVIVVFLYVYTYRKAFMEVAALTKLLKRKTNG
jgi:hypothetical protein